MEAVEVSPDDHLSNRDYEQQRNRRAIDILFTIILDISYFDCPFCTQKYRTYSSCSLFSSMYIPFTQHCPDSKPDEHQAIRAQGLIRIKDSNQDMGCQQHHDRL